MSRSARVQFLGNLIVFVFLLGVGLSFIFLTEGEWWVAQPDSARWFWAGLSLTLYLLFSIYTYCFGLTLIPKSRKR